MTIKILLQASVNLVSLRSAISASRIARVWNSCGFFFSFLHDQMYSNTSVMIRTTGSLNSSSIRPRSRRTSWIGSVLGTWGWSTWTSQSETCLFIGQETSAWLRLSCSLDEQLVQTGLGAFLIFSLCSRSCVGRMLWSIFHRNVLCLEQSPSRLARDQDNSQFTIGFLISDLQGFKVLSVGEFMVTLLVQNM